MSVIVTNMEMPDGCMFCELIATNKAAHKVLCAQTNNEKDLRCFDYEENRMEDCPLCSLDSVVEQVRKLYKDSLNGTAGDYIRGWDNALDACIAVISESAEISEEEAEEEETMEEYRRTMDEMGPANDYEMYGDPHFYNNRF